MIGNAARRVGQRWISSTPGRVPQRGLLRVFALTLAATWVCGCAEGVRWEIGPYPEIHRRAAAADQLTFVYFRSWYLVECTQFEEQVLKDPEVLAELRPFVAVPLDFDYDQPLATKWGIDDRPAYVIVTPEGAVLSRNQIPITKRELLEDLRSAKQQMSKENTPE